MQQNPRLLTVLGDVYALCHISRKVALIYCISTKTSSEGTMTSNFIDELKKSELDTPSLIVTTDCP